MKSITIHKLDDALAERLADIARDNNTSLNRTIKRLLADALGYDPQLAQRRAGFAALCGVWNDEQRREVEANLADFESIDPRDWQ